MKKAQTIAKKTLASTTVATLVMSAMAAVPTMAADAATTAPNYVGKDRIETAIKIAEGSWKDSTWSASKTAVIVAQDNENLVDGLAVAPLAYKSKAPILLSVKGDKISAETMDVLKKHGVTKVYIATGVGNITAKAEAQLKEAGVTTVTRLAGKDRYETATKIAAELGSASKEVVVVNGEAMADAMSIASVAATKGMPIYLSKDKNTVPAGLEGKTIYAVGGQALAAGATKTFAGSDRFETNAKVLEGFKEDFKYNTTYLAEGSEGHLVDALTGSVLAAQTKSPIVLTDTKLTTTQAAALKAGVTKDTQVVSFGGAVSESVKAEVGAIVNPPVTTLAVSSVSAINATQMKVEFTQEVDKTSAQNVANYSFDTVSGSTKLRSVGGAVLGKDNKTVILTFDTTSGHYTYTKDAQIAVVVSNVTKKGDPSVGIPKYATTVTTIDTTAPELVAVESAAATQTTSVKLTFSEMVRGVGTYKINGVPVSVTPFTPGNESKYVTLTAPTPLLAGSTNAVEIINEEDLAVTNGTGNKMATNPCTKSFNVTTDTTAQGIKSATVMDDNKVVIVFNEDMDSSTIKSGISDTGNIKVLDENSTAIDVAVAQPDPLDDSTYVLKIAESNLFALTATRNLTLVTTNAVKDALGNKVTPENKAFSVTQDTTKPVATSAVAIKNTDGDLTGFEVAFDSTLATGTPTTTGVRAINASGTEITSALGLGSSAGSVVATAPNKLTISFTAVPLSSTVNGSIQLVLPASMTGLTDNSYGANANVAKNLIVDLGTGSSAAMTATITSPSANAYRVVFNQSVKPETALNLNNYKLGGLALPEGTLIVLSTANLMPNSQADITLPTGYISIDNPAATFIVSGVQNATGTKTVNTTVAAVPTADQVAPVLQSARVLDNKNIILTFDENMFDAAGASVGTEFVIKQDGTTLALTDAQLTADDVPGYGKQVKLTINGNASAGSLASVGSVTAGTNTGTLTAAGVIIGGTYTGSTNKNIVIKVTAVDGSNKPTKIAISTNGGAFGTDIAVTADGSTAVSLGDGLTATIANVASAVGDTFAFTATAAVPAVANVLDLTKTITITTLDVTSNDVKDASLAHNEMKGLVTVTVTK